MLRTDIKPGAKLKYRGDRIAYVSAKNLITKGRDTGMYLLPGYQRNDSHPSGKEWVDLPGDGKAIYEITKIEAGRTHKRTGQPMEDMIHFKTEAYQAVTFALVASDLSVKFVLFEEGPPTAEELAEMAATVDSRLQAKSWLENTSASGW